MATGRTGYQPRNTPAERRAFFDQQRKLTEAAKVAADALTQAEADTRYVNVAGDTMTGTLKVEGSDGDIRLGAGSTGRHLEAYSEAGARVAYIQPDDTMLRLTSDVGPIGLRPGPGTVDRLTVDGTDVTVTADPTLNLGVATKQYVDARGHTLIRRRLSRASGQSCPAGQVTTISSYTDVENVGGITQASGVFTVPVNGTYAYLFGASSGTAIVATVDVLINVTGVVMRIPGTSNTSQAAAAIIYTTTSDSIQFQINNKSATAVTITPLVEITRIA